MSDAREQSETATEQRSGVESVIDEIDGMDYYGVTLSVNEYDPEEQDIEVSFWKDNSARHIQSTRFYYGTPHNGNTEEWRCIMSDNYAVANKALDTLNEVA